MMAVDARIVALAKLFQGRMDEDALGFASDYVNHGENVLALEMLM